MNGIALGLLDGALVGVRVQKTKLVCLFVYTYLGDIWFGFDRFAVTGSQKKFDVTILKKLCIFSSFSCKYSTLYPTNPCGWNLLLYSVGMLFKSNTSPLTFGNDDSIPQSTISVLISAGLM